MLTLRVRARLGGVARGAQGQDAHSGPLCHQGGMPAVFCGKPGGKILFVSKFNFKTIPFLKEEQTTLRNARRCHGVRRPCMASSSADVFRDS